MNLLTRVDYLEKTKEQIIQEHTKEEIEFLLKCCIEYLNEEFYNRDEYETENKIINFEEKNKIVSLPKFKPKKSLRIYELSRRVLAKHYKILNYIYEHNSNKWLENIPKDKDLTSEFWDELKKQQEKINEELDKRDREEKELGEKFDN